MLITEKIDISNKKSFIADNNFIVEAEVTQIFLPIELALY